MIFITGDTHGDFSRVYSLFHKYGVCRNDILIILGDAGINYYGGKRDEMLKEQLRDLPITIFAIHGNHERRPGTIPTYKEVRWHNGIVYKEDEYPNILFAKDGEIYNFDGIKAIAIGGAYSVDKYYRLMQGYNWWADEQPNKDIKARVEQTLSDNKNKIDVILSHTSPAQYIPTEMFIEGVDQSTVDRSTEDWLKELESKIQYQKWYCGHYHTNKSIDKVRFLFDIIEEFKI